MKNYHRMKQEIKTNVKAYQPAPSCSYLVEVQVGDETFEGVRSAADGRLKYRVVSNLKNSRIRC